jgi:hypothetical protein
VTGRSHVSSVLRCVVLTGIGTLAGLAIPVVVKRLMASLLYGVSASDPLTFMMVPVVLTLVTLAACLLPVPLMSMHRVKPACTRFSKGRHSATSIGTPITSGSAFR